MSEPKSFTVYPANGFEPCAICGEVPLPMALMWEDEQQGLDFQWKSPRCNDCHSKLVKELWE